MFIRNIYNELLSANLSQGIKIFESHILLKNLGTSQAITKENSESNKL